MTDQTDNQANPAETATPDKCPMIAPCPTCTAQLCTTEDRETTGLLLRGFPGNLGSSVHVEGAEETTLLRFLSKDDPVASVFVCPVCRTATRVATPNIKHALKEWNEMAMVRRFGRTRAYERIADDES